MWNFFAKLFGSDSVVDAGISAIDKVVYTKEEKSDAHMKFLQLYVPFRLAQRFLALIFGIPYALAWLITFCASFIKPVAIQVSMLSDPEGIAPIVWLIVAFYFGGGAAEGLVRSVGELRKTKAAS